MAPTGAKVVVQVDEHVQGLSNIPFLVCLKLRLFLVELGLNLEEGPRHLMCARHDFVFFTRVFLLDKPRVLPQAIRTRRCERLSYAARSAEVERGGELARAAHPLPPLLILLGWYRS